MSDENEFSPQLRYDSLSGEWVVISQRRGERPKDFGGGAKKEKKSSEKNCPFCHLEKEEIILLLRNGKRISFQNKLPSNWTLAVIPNKYPAFLPAERIIKEKEGEFYEKMSAVGFCELVITRDHNKHFPQFSLAQIKEVIDAYQLRYLALKKRKFVKYVSIFHNHGPRAGASLSHPHSQIITTPLIDVDLKRALANSKRYFRRKKKCAYCQMNKWEEKVRRRIVFENEGFLVFTPFASKAPFQLIISPKHHSPHFEKIREKEKWQLSQAFKKAMVALYKGLSNPDYNFYIHTAPSDGKDYSFYHWHLTIIPKIEIIGGFELGARMEISTVLPERAAEYLRKQL